RVAGRAHAVWYAAVRFFFQADDGIRDRNVTGVQTCALPIYDIRRAQFQQSFQTVVPVNNSPVKIVQVRGGKTASIQLHHGTQIQIGRASCRERVEVAVVAGGEVKKSGGGLGQRTRQRVEASP